MSTTTLAVTASLAEHIDDQRSLVSDALAIVDVAIAAMPEGRVEDPEVRGALRIARRLLEEATEGLDRVNIERAAEVA
jgi:hypothetical protein